MDDNLQRPLLLTLRMDDTNQSFFDGQRDLYFPPSRNFLKAHIMLFHQLPQEESTLTYLRSIRQPPFDIAVTGLMNLGGGVAYALNNADLKPLHQRLTGHFAEVLIPQDKQPLRAHVTIQNKVSPEQARALLDELKPGFEPFSVTAQGMDIWVYLGGPWKHLEYVPFGYEDNVTR